MPAIPYSFAVKGDVRPQEIMDLRGSVGWDIENEAVWEQCLAQALCWVTARDGATSQLVGIGFLVGNARHAMLVDMSVHPKVQRHGIGRRLQAERIAYAREHKVRYVTLNVDDSKPWLRRFYETMGFETATDCMRLRQE